MQDIDDFDPLDDILLSDEEPPDPKNNFKNQSYIFSKPKEHDAADNLSKDDKKKKMLAELFGTKQESKKESLKNEEVIIPQTKSDWLDLKTETKSGTLESTLNKTVTWHTPSENSQTLDAVKKDVYSESIFTSENDDIFNTEPSLVHRNNDSLDRRKSESSAPRDSKKSKQRFKSLDLDLNFDFDAPNEAEMSTNKKVLGDKEKILKDTVPELGKSSTKTTSDDTKNSISQEKVEKDITALFYVPSTGSRRMGTSKSRIQATDSSTFPSFLSPDHSKNVIISDTLKDSLPTWLEVKKTNEESATFFKSDNPDKSSRAVNSENISESVNNITFADKNVRISDSSGSNVPSTILELKKKHEELKNIAKAQTNNLIRHELEIQNSAFKLILEHRNNINDLMQIILPENMSNEINQNLNNSEDLKNKIANFENTVSQLQVKLIQQELEKSELLLKLEYADKKYSTDLAALEDLYNYKLKVAKEKENHLKTEVQNIEEEFIVKLQQKKEDEEKIINSYKEKIRIMQEEHLNEVKYIFDYQEVKTSLMENKTKSITYTSNEKIISKDLTAKEIVLENRQKELLELEEEINKQKLTLEGKCEQLKARMEDFEARSAKEKLSMEQQKKDLKLSQLIFEEKETSWEKEKQREKEYLRSYKEELESMKESFLKEEKKLLKEKFELSAEKARIEVILNLDGTPGQLDNILLNRAELQGALEEVNHLKEKLRFEREEIKKEDRRLKEESWKLKEIEQQLMLQNKHHQKLLSESETKREEGIQALKKAQRIESQMNERIEEIENRLSNLRKKEEKLIQEQIEISKERDLINKKRYHLDMILPELTYEEQMPFNIMNRGIIDPKIMIMKWKTENEMDSLFGQ